MDLGTIASRLESNLYGSPGAVAEDVRLVWRNCRTFNEPGSDVYKSCDELAGFFDQLWKQAKLEKGHVRTTLSLAQPLCNLYFGVNSACVLQVSDSLLCGGWPPEHQAC